MEELRIYKGVKRILDWIFLIIILSFLISLIGVFIWDGGKCVIAIIVLFIAFIVDVLCIIKNNEIIDKINKSLILKKKENAE